MLAAEPQDDRDYGRRRAARRSVSLVRSRHLGHRSGTHRQTIQVASGQGSRRLLRRGARVWPCGQRAAVDRVAAGGDGSASCGVRARLRSSARAVATRAAGSSMDSRPRSDGAAHGPAADAREAGSIEAFFLEGDEASSPNVGPALDTFSARALATDMRAAYGSGCRASAVSGTSFRGLLPAAPASGSICSCGGWFDATRSTLASGRRSRLRD